MAERDEAASAIPAKYIPTPAELIGESWEYCYGNPSVIGPPPSEHSDTE